MAGKRVYRKDMQCPRCGSNWLPQNRHVVGKGLEANRNEGLHSVLRGKLNRLIRRTKGYSKSEAMLRDSIALLCLPQLTQSREPSEPVGAMLCTATQGRWSFSRLVQRFPITNTR